jgi:hypothetical protein
LWPDSENGSLSVFHPPLLPPTQCAFGGQLRKSVLPVVFSKSATTTFEIGSSFLVDPRTAFLQKVKILRYPSK